MEITVRKTNIIATSGLLCLVSGLLVYDLFIKALIEGGWFYFGLLTVFFLNLFFVISYFNEYRLKVKLAEEASKEVVGQELKNNPQFFSHTSPDVLRKQIKDRLISKIDEERVILISASRMKGQR